MAYEDKDDTKFPTRFGQATGHANERTMLEELGGANGIRHRQRVGPDGVTTHVKTRGGHPHFWNEPLPGSDEEPVSPIYMDSGAVDMLSISSENPLSPLAAPLYYSTDQKTAYAAEKLLGKIAPPDITNPAPPVDTEPGESFIPVTGGDILGKKECAARCPPSMFTGKARLYAQAQLGAPLRKWGWTIDYPELQAPRWVHDSTGFVLDINVGIYTDGDNKHWLISISGAGVTVTPLKPSKSAKLLVPNLSDPSYAGDKTKIEAYILAHSTPGGAAESFFVEVPGLPPPFMLGYGWKFNWGGNKADIIEHSEGSPRHTSSHYRLTISRNMSSGISTESNRWSFTLSLVEGPVSWHNTQYAQAIASPDWSTNLLYIFGTLYGGQYGSNAPVYCFYKENDELEIFRYSTSGGEGGVMYMVTSEPAQWMWPVDWTTENLLIYTHFGSTGLEGAEGERRVRTATPTVSGFSCGQASAVSSEQSYEFDRYTLSGKTFVGDGAIWYSTNVGFNAYEQNRFARDTGWSSYYVTGDGKTRYTSGVGLIIENGEYLGYASGSDTYMATLGYSRYYYDGTHVETLKTALIIPFHDAEAAYLWGNLSTTETATVTGGYCETTTQPGFFCNRARYVFSDGHGGYTYYYYFEYAGGDGTHLAVNNDPNTDLNEVTDTLIASKIVTRSGAYEFSSETSMSPFFAGTPYVTQQFSTVSSVNALLYGQGVQYVPGVNLVNFLLRPTFVGWA